MTESDQFAAELQAYVANIEGRVMKVNKRIESLDKNVSMISQTLARIEDNQFSEKAYGKAISSEVGTSHKVRSGDCDYDRNNIQLGYRGIHNVLKNQNGILKNIELPVFDGTRPYGWITQAERFFRLGNYSDVDKLDLMSVSLQGPALNWYNQEIHREEFQDWPQFKRRMVARFSQLITKQINNQKAERFGKPESMVAVAIHHEKDSRQEKKEKIPVFRGLYPYGWIGLVQRFFKMCHYDEEEKMNLVSLSLDGDALSWYLWEAHQVPFVDWLDFKTRLLAKFGQVKRKSSPELISKKQMTQELICVKESTETASLILGRESVEEELTTNIEEQGLHETPSSNPVTDCVTQPLKVTNSIFDEVQEASWICSKESLDRLQSQSGFVFDVLPSTFGIGVLFALKEEQLYVLHVPEMDELEQKTTSGNEMQSAQMALRVQSQRKQRKYPKAWKFKYKHEKGSIRKRDKQHLFNMWGKRVSWKEHKFAKLYMHTWKSKQLQFAQDFKSATSTLWVALLISTTNQMKSLHIEIFIIQRTEHCIVIKRTDPHLWHYWKKKTRNLLEISVFTMLCLVSFQPSKRNGLLSLLSGPTAEDNEKMVWSLIHDNDDVEVLLKHKWRFKLLNTISELGLSLESVACVVVSSKHFSAETTLIDEAGTRGENLQLLTTTLYNYKKQKQLATKNICPFGWGKIIYGRDILTNRFSATSRETIQGDFRHSYLLVAAANWRIEMHLGITSYHVWHRWKARYLQIFEYVLEV